MTRIQDKPPANLRISKTERSLKSEKGPKRRAEKASEEPHYELPKGHAQGLLPSLPRLLPPVSHHEKRRAKQRVFSLSAYPTIDRITGVLCAGILLGCLLGCLGPGEGREAHAQSHEADKPIAAAAAYQRPVETGRIEELIEYHNPTPLSDELFRTVDAAADTYHVPICLALGLIEVESGFDAEAVSPKGCYGLTQLNPQYFPAGLSAEENVQTSLAHLGSLLERYDTMTALTIYNAGRDTGSRVYANKVLDAAWAWEREFREDVTS